MRSTFFKETQKFSLGWRWIFFIAVYAIMFWPLIQQFSESTDIVGVIAIVFSVVILVFFNFVIVIMTLETRIDESKISYQFKPFHRKPREIAFSEIEKFYLRKYKPIKEYGGYGIQRKLKYGRSFTVKGKDGLQLILNDGKKILIGTQKPKELEKVIEKIKNSN